MIPYTSLVSYMMPDATLIHITLRQSLCNCKCETLQKRLLILRIVYHKIDGLLRINKINEDYHVNLHRQNSRHSI